MISQAQSRGNFFEVTELLAGRQVAPGTLATGNKVNTSEQGKKTRADPIFAEE